MPWAVNLIEEQQIVECIYAAPLPPEELYRAAATAAKSAREAGASRFLADCRGLVQEGSPFEVLDLVKFFESLDLPLGLREAVLLPSGAGTRADMTFFETAAQNRGWDVKLFTDRDEALAFLGAKGSR